MKKLLTLLIVTSFCALLSAGQTTPKVLDVNAVPEVTMLGTTPVWSHSAGLSADAVYVCCGNKLYAVDKSKIYGFALNGTAVATELTASKGKLLASNGNSLFQISNDNRSLVVIDPATGAATTVGLTVPVNVPSFISASGNYVFVFGGNQLAKIDATNGKVSTAALAGFGGNVYINAVDADNVFVSCPAKAGVYNFAGNNFTAAALSTDPSEVAAGRGINTAIGGYCEVTVGNHNIKLFPSGAESEMFSGYNVTNGTVNYYYAGGVKPSNKTVSGNANNYLFYNNGFVYQVCPAAGNAINCYKLDVLNSADVFAPVPGHVAGRELEYDDNFIGGGYEKYPNIAYMHGVVNYSPAPFESGHSVYSDKMSVVGYGTYLREHTGVGEGTYKFAPRCGDVPQATTPYLDYSEEFIQNPYKDYGENAKIENSRIWPHRDLYVYHTAEKGNAFKFYDLKRPFDLENTPYIQHFGYGATCGPYKLDNFVFYKWYGQIDFKSNAYSTPFIPDYKAPKPVVPTVKAVWSCNKLYFLLDFDKLDNDPEIPVSRYAVYKARDKKTFDALNAKLDSEHKLTAHDDSCKIKSPEGCFSYFVEENEVDDAYITEMSGKYNFSTKDNAWKHGDDRDIPFVLCLYVNNVPFEMRNELAKAYSFRICPSFAMDHGRIIKEYNFLMKDYPEAKVKEDVPTSVEGITGPDEIKVFPTLVEDRITVLSSEEIDNVDVYSLSGVMVKHVEGVNDAITEADLSDLASGTYFVKVNNSKVVKIIKR